MKIKIKREENSVCFESDTPVTSCQEPEISVHGQLTTHHGQHLEVCWDNRYTADTAYTAVGLK